VRSVTFEGELKQIIETARAEQSRKDAEDTSFNSLWGGISKIVVEVFNAAGLVFSEDPDYSCRQDAENGSKHLKVKKFRGGEPEKWLSFSRDSADRKFVCTSSFAELNDKVTPDKMDESIVKGKVKEFVTLALKP
jgi:hypothetical protein